MPKPSSKSSGEMGNTKSISPSIRWCFTLHDYTESNIKHINTICDLCSKFWMFSCEMGKSGNTPHLQGYIEFNKKVRPKNMFDINTIHWEKAKGNRTQNETYIRKEGGDLWINGRLETRLILLDPDNFYPWQRELYSCLLDTPNDRTIHWYWEDKGGAGKSAFVKWLCATQGAITLSHKGADMKYAIVKYHETKKIYPTIILIDLPRSTDCEHLNYPTIESIKNGCFFSGKYESVQVIMPYPHIVIFANKPPDICKLSIDRWHIVNIS